ncbi:MAG: hypothetical protein JOZ20_05670, partial [Sphingomonas sp.]|nr:hypothetical protein [Sphingomonas sp.]
MSLPLALVFSAAAAQALAQRPPQLPPLLPLTQIDDRGLSADLDNKTFSLTFSQPVGIQDVLLLLVRGTNLSIVPEPTING